MAHKVVIDKKEYSSCILDRLEQMRRDDKHCNFTIRVGSEEIQAHRSMLCAASGYFDVMLTHNTRENRSGIVEMIDVDEECVKICIDHIYGRQVAVPPEKYEQLMFVAELMQLQMLTDGIITLLGEKLNLKLFFMGSRIADLFGYKNLEERCVEFAQMNFSLISKEEKFTELSETYIAKMIKSKKVKMTEEEKLDALQRWVDFDSERTDLLTEMLKFIKLEEISAEKLEHLMENDSRISNNFQLFKIFSASLINIMERKTKSDRAEATSKSNAEAPLFDEQSGSLQRFKPKTNSPTKTHEMENKIKGFEEKESIDESVFSASIEDKINTKSPPNIGRLWKDAKSADGESTSSNMKEHERTGISEVGEIITLPEVEEAIARQDGQSIMMTWKQIPIDRVSYWIQVYCDEERTGEPFVTGDLKHRVEFPVPGSRYTFIVWAERDGTQSEHRTLSRNFIMVHLAGEEDSEIQMNGCRVKFPRGTFKEITRVWMSVKSDYCLCPDECFPITPIMDIDIDSQLHKDATVQMRSCCIGLDKSQVNILHFENLAGMEWTSITPQNCAEDGLIEFQCREFSPWLITLARRLFSKFVINIHLYVTGDQFRFVIFKNSGNEQKRVKVTMKDVGARLAEVYEQCVVKRGDKITIKPWVDGEPQSLKCTPDVDYVIIDNRLLRKDFSSVRFQLKEIALSDKVYPIYIRCHISLNDKIVDKGGRFRYPLQPRQSGPKPVQIIHQNTVTGMSVEGGRGNITMQDSEISVQATSSS